MMKGIKRLLAGEYVPVHVCGKVLLAIIRGEELASSSLCAAVGGKSQPTEIWERLWKGIIQQLSMSWRLW